PAGTRVRAVAEEVVVARRAVRGMGTGTRAVAVVVGADVAVSRTGRGGEVEAIVGRLVAGLGALGARRARVARVVHAAPGAVAGVGAVTEESVVAARAGQQIGMRARARAVADVVGARVAVARARTGVVRVDAAAHLVAAVGRARIAVVACRGTDR